MIQEVKRRIWVNDFRGFDPDAIMAAAYRQFALEFSDQYRQFVHAVLEAGGAPVLWHCTAGKDRAGFASALVLRLLGAEQRVVLQDYMLSADHLKPIRKALVLLRLAKGAKVAQTLRSLLKVDEHWLETAFQAIDEHWGSFDSYTHQALRLSTADITQLRHSLLE